MDVLILIRQISLRNPCAQTCGSSISSVNMLQALPSMPESRKSKIRGLVRRKADSALRSATHFDTYESVRFVL